MRKPARTFPLRDGDYYNATLMQKGLENLKESLRSAGYITLAPFQASFDDQKKTVSWDIDIDEGKPFTFPH